MSKMLKQSEFGEGKINLNETTEVKNGKYGKGEVSEKEEIGKQTNRDFLIGRMIKRAR